MNGIKGMLSHDIGYSLSLSKIAHIFVVFKAFKERKFKWTFLLLSGFHILLNTFKLHLKFYLFHMKIIIFFFPANKSS